MTIIIIIIIIIILNLHYATMPLAGYRGACRTIRAALFWTRWSF